MKNLSILVIGFALPRDLGRVDHLLNVQDPEAAGFFLQQAVEKFLKAFLLSRGWELQRIHDLETLLNVVLAYDPSLEPFRSACQKITGFYIGGTLSVCCREWFDRGRCSYLIDTG